MSTSPGGGWVAVTDYPAWPSPYFAELHRHAPPGLPLGFASSLTAIPGRPTRPGVINLHRLKRLYRDRGGQRTLSAARTMLDQLQALRDGGWRIVWTVHNLLPIDGGPPRDADWYAALGVLGIADTVLTHTYADALHLARLTTAPIIVAGWGGLSATADAGPVPESVRVLLRRLRAAPCSMLAMGNITPYKDLPAAVEAFTAHTRRAHLLIAGPCRDEALAADLVAAARRCGGRVYVHPQRVPPEHVHHLYRVADAALCPYRVDGPWEFFTGVLYPGSIGTALAFGTPVIAPHLPAIAEMTTGSPARLYPPDEGPGPAMAAAEAAHQRPRPRLRRVGDSSARWRAVTAVYRQTFERLTCENNPPATTSRDNVTASPGPGTRRFTSTCSPHREEGEGCCA
ncbi:glycosyltransferase [Streptosporangium sp. NBC_01755]|uniref:glycosyltransferase n=1 Tax=Streptosporangium sp. NBC_01755 TaxID=2975949 RepID=UPI002DD97C95|nr:glycosyltransferase [Streptosporangium sp. NBC_01755]WSD02512.1 glycosyltransferase [Streptosporangium sp. NBC_01755]